MDKNVSTGLCFPYSCDGKFDLDYSVYLSEECVLLPISAPVVFGYFPATFVRGNSGTIDA